MREMYCLNCGQRGYPKTFTKGSFIMELFLWLLFIIPGVIYSIWRLTTRHSGCPACQAPNMIPLDSPRAIQAGIPERELTGAEKVGRGAARFLAGR